MSVQFMVDVSSACRQNGGGRVQMNTHPMIDTSRPWEQRMQQARDWTLARLHAVPPPNNDELMEAAAKAIARKLPGWKLAAPFDYRADYRRIIRRNLGRGKLP